MKETLKTLTNAPIVQKLRVLENRKMERWQTRKKLFQTKLSETAKALDAQIKEDLRQQIKDIETILLEDEEQN